MAVPPLVGAPRRRLRHRPGRVARRCQAGPGRRAGAEPGQGRRPRARPARHRPDRRRGRSRARPGHRPRGGGGLRAHHPPPVLDALAMVNLHFSLLPRWRGAAPVERAILAGDERTGVCVMAVEEGLDTGGVYARVEIPIGRRRDRRPSCGPSWSTPGTTLLVDQLQRRAGDGRAPGGRGHLRRQAHRRRAASSTGPDRPIEIHRRVRVGDAWTTFRGRRLKVWRTAVVDGSGTDRRRRSPWSLASWPEPASAPGPASSSWSRCSPRARPARRPRPGPTAPARVPVSGSARDRPAVQAPPVAARPSRAARRPSAPAGAANRRGTPPAGVAARRVAIDALVRIDTEGAYANLVVPALLGRCRSGRARPGLRDRAGLRLDPYAPRLRLAGGPLPAARPRRPHPGHVAHRRLPAGLPGHAAARRGQRHGGRRPVALGRPGQRGAAQGGQRPPGVARRGHRARATRTGSSTCSTATSAPHAPGSPSIR